MSGEEYKLMSSRVFLLLFFCSVWLSALQGGIIVLKRRRGLDVRGGHASRAGRLFIGHTAELPKRWENPKGVHFPKKMGFSLSRAQKGLCFA
jgi:hypothetical protein